MLGSLICCLASFFYDNKNFTISLQTCFFKVGSYGFDDSYVKFNLSKAVAEFNLPDHPVVGLKNYDN